MKNLITKSNKHLLWQDALGEPFLLLKWAEVFKYSNKLLGLHIFGALSAAPMLKNGLIFNQRSTDDHILVAYALKDSLPFLLAFKPFRRRPNIKGNWIKQKEKLLGHKILPYKPKLFKN